MWELIKNNLHFIIPIFLPLGFFIVDIVLKAVMREKNFDSLGSDTCLAGCSLFIGTLLAQIYYKRLTDPTDTVTGFIFSLIFLSLWWVCLSLSYKKFPIARGSSKQPLFSGIVGCGSFYGCAVYTWQLLS
jgi:hypothetical protein